jgi:DNA-directed RNA polymerase subunit alpha
MIPLSKKPKIIKKEKNRAVFEIEALYPGCGITIGNSLRRILLSSLQGTAVTQMKVKGVSHEFSTIPGVWEDGITIMLNLKQLKFKMLTEEPQKATLKVKGEKKVLGSDFELPSQLELVNKDCHIATLTDKKSKLEIEIKVEKGIGFSSKEERKKEKLEIGTIALDAIFTPVKKVAFQIESMRVGERTDFDRLFLDVETYGTISPEEAFFEASVILVKHFDLFAEAFKKEVSVPEVKEEKVEGKGKKKVLKKKTTKKTKKVKHAKKKKRKKT